MFKRTLLNVTSNLGLLGLKVAIAFIMTPILVRNLGNHDYGIWEITGSVVGYFGLLELGLRPTVSRFVARYNRLGEPDSIRTLYVTATVLLGVSGLIAFVSFVTWGLLAPGALAAEGDSPERYRWYLLIIGTQLLIVMPSYVAESFLEGLQRFYLKNVITAVNSVIGAGLVIALINPENALLILAGLNAAGVIIKYLIFQGMVRARTYGGVGWKSGRWSRPMAKELVIFGGKSFIQGASGNLASGVPNIVIGLTLGAAQVVFYSLPRALAMQVRNVVMHITVVFMPLFADLAAKGDARESARVFFPVTTLLTGIVTLAALGIAWLGPPFISVWIGPEYGQRAEVLAIIMAVDLWLMNLNPMASRLLTAMDRHVIFAKLAPVSAALSGALAVGGAWVAGLEGIAAGMLLGRASILWPILRETCRALGCTMAEFLARTLRPVLLPGIATAVLFVGAGETVKLEGYIPIFGTAGAASLVFAAIFLLTAGESERALVLRILRGNRPLRPAPRA